MNAVSVDRIERARKIFVDHGGTLRTSDAVNAGIHPEVLYTMRDTGALERLARGLYRLTDAPEMSQPDLVTVALKAPKGVICMISALGFHAMTTQIPHAVDIALVRGSEPPRIDYPPIRVYWAVEHIFECGIEKHLVDGQTIHIYNPERALVDCFRYRNKIGLDTAMEALRFYREKKQLKVDRIMEYARICKVARVIKPYLEGTL